jgi:hypothetical protein
MSYLLTIDNLVRADTASGNVQNLLRNTIPALQVSKVMVLPCSLAPGQVYAVDLSQIPGVVLLAIDSTAPVDISLMADEDSEDIYSGFPGNFHLRYFSPQPTSALIGSSGHLKIQASLAADVTIIVAGVLA